jgi:tetratricopeptide (TPR) repeat protein
MKSNVLLAIAVITFGFVGVFLLSSFLERNRITVPDSYQDEDLALQGRKLKGYALGAEGLLADWYWMRSLQYIGDKVLRKGIDKVNIDDLTEMNPRLLYPMLDNATELDPKLMAAFSYGATVLPAIDSQQAIKLTEKGIAANPNEWRLLQYLGYIYWKLKDYEKAGEVYDRGAAMPGAPPFFRMMAARIRTESGSRDLAREIYKQSIAEAPDIQSKTVGELRLMELDSMDERDAIDAVLGEYRERTGKCAKKWSDIVPRLANVRLPNDRKFRMNAADEIVDPSGTAYVLDGTTCTAQLSPSTKIPLR